ncbi:MAG: hypothetical protein EOP34_10770 [Rickettsiales bacterium]|nr:MAG: hypothetical protein EOP34_10770 [Rickettsiales bacterium]
MTTVFSSLIGLYQQDIKKVIAYSTMSQLAQKYTTHSSIFRHQTICESTFLSLSIKNLFKKTYPKIYKYFTTNDKGLSNDNALNPYYLTGFTDAEGCFLINIQKRSDVLLGYSDYKIFILVFEYIKSKKHLTKKGFIEILSLKASLNNGLTEELKRVFPNIVPSLRPQTITPKLDTIDPH